MIQLRRSKGLPRPEFPTYTGGFICFGSRYMKVVSQNILFGELFLHGLGFSVTENGKGKLGDFIFHRAKMLRITKSDLWKGKIKRITKEEFLRNLEGSELIKKVIGVFI